MLRKLKQANSYQQERLFRKPPTLRSLPAADETVYVRQWRLLSEGPSVGGGRMLPQGLTVREAGGEMK